MRCESSNLSACVASKQRWSSMVLVTFTLTIEMHSFVPTFFLALVPMPDFPLRKSSLRSSEMYRVALGRSSAKLIVSKVLAKKTCIRTIEILLTTPDRYDRSNAIPITNIVKNSLAYRRDLCNRSKMSMYRQTIGVSACCRGGDNEVWI